MTNFFILELNDHDVQELWFQQDGATCPTARATIDLLKYTFGDRLISRFGPVNWPPRSCDLTPLDYFLWGYVKSLVYADKPQTLGHLEDSIRRVIADIRPQMLEKVIENWTSRLDYIRASRGSHMPEIIFKIKMASFFSFCSSRTLAVVVLAILCCSLLCETRAQQFYPNGRYGRRSVIPPLAESTQDFRVAISGEDSMICKFTGYADYYRCTSDEAHFWLNGYVNKQNCRIWSEANPQVYVKTPLHPEKLTFWCALWAGGILLQKR
ncbi:uncharacterized protein TNCV_347261 [Trichonephila clavipes]|nr:uncharacterized protein TNCV_347261 [Trichonephila clavipes]